MYAIADPIHRSTWSHLTVDRLGRYGRLPPYGDGYVAGARDPCPIRDGNAPRGCEGHNNRLRHDVLTLPSVGHKVPTGTQGQSI